MPIAVFTEAVRNLLEQGRGKFCNILIKGPANTGKTYLLNPLNTIYKSFTNPARHIHFRLGRCRKSRSNFLERLPMEFTDYPVA